MLGGVTRIGLAVAGLFHQKAMVCSRELVAETVVGVDRGIEGLELGLLFIVALGQAGQLLGRLGRHHRGQGGGGFGAMRGRHRAT